jgi:hypothetical protein
MMEQWNKVITFYGIPVGDNRGGTMEHTLHRSSNVFLQYESKYWIDCGQETIAEKTFVITPSLEEEVKKWTDEILAKHECLGEHNGIDGPPTRGD